MLAAQGLQARLEQLTRLHPGWGLCWQERPEAGAQLIGAPPESSPEALSALAGLLHSEEQPAETRIVALPDGSGCLARRLPVAAPARAVFFAAGPPGSQLAPPALFEAAAALAAELIEADNRQAAALEQARREEQARLGRHLHDTLAQSLFAIGLEAESAVRSGAEPDRLEKIRRLARRSSDTLRSQLIALQNQPAGMGNSLAGLMQARAGRFEQQTGLGVMLALAPEVDQLSAAQVEAVYRLYAEMLQAVGILGGAHTLLVRLEHSAMAWSLSVEDDYAPSDPAAQRRRAQALKLDETGEDLLEALGGAAVVEIASPGNVILRARFPA